MNSNGNLAALEEYANQRMRFKKSCFESLDFREMYIKVLTQKGYSEDDNFFIDYMFKFPNRKGFVIKTDSPGS